MGPRIRNSTHDAFGHELAGVGLRIPGHAPFGLVLEVPVGRARAHRLDRAHAAVALVAPALGTARPRPAPRAFRRTESRSCRQSAPAAMALAMSPLNLMPPSAMMLTLAACAASAHSADRGELGDPHSRHHPRGADRSGPDPDLHHVGTRIDAGPSRLRSRHVAHHHGSRRCTATSRRPLRRAPPALCPCAVSIDQQVDPRLDKHPPPAPRDPPRPRPPHHRRADPRRL